MSADDLKKITGVKANECRKSLKKLLTKQGKLRVPVGDAHKDWQLVCVKNTKVKDTTEARAEAEATLVEIIKGKVHHKVNFVFSRRILG